MRRRSAIGLVGGLAALAAAALVLVPAIPQDPAYHRLADSRAWLGIPNALNVLSNTGFLLVGALGLAYVAAGASPAFREPGERWPYVVFFGGLLLTGFGSAYYHWEPGNARLAWDRLPLAITLMGLLAATIAERIGVKSGLVAAGPPRRAGGRLRHLLALDRAAGRGRSPPLRPGPVLSARGDPAHAVVAGAPLHERGDLLGGRGDLRGGRGGGAAWTGGFSRRPAW